MKKTILCCLPLLLFSISSMAQQYFTDTKGELQISASGSATYTLPVAVPPSIKNVAPVINLAYASGTKAGIAGQGWSLSGISAVSRIATRRDIDGYVDGVDFDNNDKLGLDGQRLLLKSGSYWADGSVYETEYKSNIRIELKIENGLAFFIVTNPDGSRAWYGCSGSGTYQNAVSPLAWYIVKHEDVHGNAIVYNYENVAYAGTSQLYISEIRFSGNESQGIPFANKIKFYYNDAYRVERDYIKGSPSYASKALNSIEVHTGGALFKKYIINRFLEVASGYERVTSIREYNGNLEPANPIVFEYETSPNTTNRIVKTYNNNLNFSAVDVGGDFDGDGKLDFIAGNQLYTNLFSGNSGNAPITIPAGAAGGFAATVLKDGKLNQKQSIAKITKINSTTSVVNVYDMISANVMELNYSKTIALDRRTIQTASITDTSPNTLSCFNYFNSTPKVGEAFISNIEGDFDGNGISEVLFIKPHSAEHHTFNKNGTPCGVNIVNSNPKFYLLDLNPNSSSELNSHGFVEVYNLAGMENNNKNIVADFNGDGRSDILFFLPNNLYRIYQISRWGSTATADLIGEGILDKYAYGKQMLLGDFNGDGKTDIMLPDTHGGQNHTLWHTYYSNPRPEGGNSFVKESYHIDEYWPDTGGTYDTQRHWSNYYAIDINGDGKSDMVKVWRNYFKPGWTINDHDTEWSVTAHTNNVGKASNPGYQQTYFSGKFYSGSPDIPIPIASNYRYQGANTELVMVRGHHNKIEYYQFNKNVETDCRLKKVREANGAIVHDIQYLPMVAGNEGLGNPATDFYSSSNSAFYPDVEIISNRSNYLVSILTATVNGQSKSQYFRYHGYISNFNYGTVGFRRTTRSSWSTIWDTRIWTTSYNEPALRGANTITWTNAGFLFNTVQDNLLTTKTNVFETYTDPVSKVYNVLLKQQTVLDALTNVKTEHHYTYDGNASSPNYFGLETQRLSKYYSGTQLQGTTTTATTYLNNPGGAGASYYIGKPENVTTTQSVYPGLPNADTRTSQETFAYNGANVRRIEKRGHNTNYSIIEEMQYDALGNLLTKTVAAPQAPVPVAPRTIQDEYDPSKRFVIKKTDHQGFITRFTYNAVGQVTQSVNYLGVINDMLYDHWGKLIVTTVTNASATPLVTNNLYYKYQNGGYQVTSHNAVGDNAMPTTVYDVLGRVIQTRTKGFANGTFIFKDIVYDALGRKQKENEPYFSTPSNRWTVYEYDYLHRPIRVTAPSGRVQTIAYNGLTTTSTDDGKTTTVTLDALGNKVNTTDPGGSINFAYYANGALKESNYGGHKITMQIDGWGNKIATHDPNAGNYTYEYDAFGQMIKETTPKGYTAYTYDGAGRLLKKKVLGDGTDVETDYGYNNFSQLEGEISKKSSGEFIDIFSYEYDNLHRPVTTTQSTSSFAHSSSVAYDTYGRAGTVTKITEAALGTTTVTKNGYNAYNGIRDKITDENNNILWQLTGANEKMQALSELLGNGVQITNIYTADNYFQSQRHSKNNADILYSTYNFNGVKGVLNSRQNHALGISETFVYDSMDRLTNWTNPLTGATDSNVYDERGRITDNNRLGRVNYNTDASTGIYRKSSIDIMAPAYEYYQNLPKQTVDYTMFKAPLRINESNKGSTLFTYNSHLSRHKMTYGYKFIASGFPANESPTKGRWEYTKSKLYTDDGSTEILINKPISNGGLFGSPIYTIRSYVGGDAYSAPLYIEKTLDENTGIITESKYYLHRDYLGSVIAISDANGNAVERRHFDAWGNLARLQQNGVLKTLPADGTAAGLMMLDRGYTSHEHLAEVGLIHMNGRLYDPVLRSFLMPDNFVQQPENTQNYNRYSYVLNNPLMYTDPSGELLVEAIIIGALISAATYTLTALLADVPFSVGGLAKATFIGAASSAVTFGIGSGAEKLFTNFFSRAAFQAAAHGTFQGGMAAVSGGKFWSGFAAGALSSIASSAWSGGKSMDGFGENAKAIPGSGMKGIGAGTGDFGTIAFGTVSGGAGAALTGGNFWQGAATGLVVSGLNHTFHNMEQKQQEKLWSKGLKSLLSKAKVGVEYDSSDLIDFGVPKQFANKISSFTLKSNNTAEITWGRMTYSGLKLVDSDIDITSRTATWKIEAMKSGDIKLSSDALKFNYAKGKTVNYFYISNSKNSISYDTKFKETWGL